MSHDDRSPPLDDIERVGAEQAPDLLTPQEALELRTYVSDEPRVDGDLTLEDCELILRDLERRAPARDRAIKIYSA